jgi:hypothetical protein
VDEALLDIPPPLKPNYITKASNEINASQNNPETKKSISLIATKKAPSKQTDNSEQVYINSVLQEMITAQMQTQPGKTLKFLLIKPGLNFLTIF